MFNVLKGDMSFIGPRPLLIQYLPLYSKEQSRRHNVRPVLRDGLKSMDAMRFHGNKSLSMMFGMPTMYHLR
jgi:lipopolysaccharide/colanic/teichoic acid biosynthesis glycosyltransferase